MKRTMDEIKQYDMASLVRRLIAGWSVAAALEFLLLSEQGRELSTLDGLAQMSFSRLIFMAVLVFALQCLAARFLRTAKAERWILVGALMLLTVTAVAANFSRAFLLAGILVCAVALAYGIWGWDGSKRDVAMQSKDHPFWRWILIAASMLFFLFVSAWTVCRVTSFCTPSFDFGIFSQMFHYMKESGLPLTTLERDGLLSHFAVHMSPIYYLMLPFYCLFPRPETLQVLQAVVMTTAVIPLWLHGKHHGFPALQRVLVCAVLLLYPAFSGGVAYDLHENCFLTPLLLWLLYGIDRKNVWIVSAAAILTFLVKEDAPVYVAIIGLYLLLRAILHKEFWGSITGGALLAISVAYFFAVTGHLASSGDGVMTYRYSNFMYDGSESLVTVIKAVLMSPMKALFECVDPEKLEFLGQTMIPLLGIPLLTRRFERYILLIPYVLVNLMPDYQYQHNIFFQYCFGSSACLIYLVLVNLADLQELFARKSLMIAAVAVSAGFFLGAVVPTGCNYLQRQVQYEAYFEQLETLLDQIPEDAPVAASTFYTTYLSQREELYDVRYCSRSNLLRAEYVALAVSESGSYRNYGGYEGLVKYLENNGYEVYANMGRSAVIYHKSSS